jgi:hypothetical protein
MKIRDVFKLIALLSVASIMPVIIAENTPDLLRNGNMVVAGKDINGLPEGWTPKHCEGVETTAAFKTVALDARKVAELTWVDGSANFGIQPSDKVKFEQGKAYEFSALGKTGGDGKLQLVVEIYAQANIGGRLLVCEATGEISAPEWKKLSVCFEVPAKAAEVNVYCLNRGQGQAWYTDVSLIPVPPERIASVFPIKFGCEPAEGNAIWNGGKAVFNTFADSPCSLTFDFWGDVKKLKNPAMVIDLPDGIELADCFYPNPSINALKVAFRKSEIERDWQKYTRYTFENTKSFGSIKPVPAWLRSLTVMFKPTGKATTDKLFKAFCFVQNGQEKSPEKIFYVNVLPPLPQTPKPKIFQTVMPWKNYDLASSDPELFKAVIRRFEEANMTCRALGGNKEDKVCRERGWKMAFFYGNNIILTPIVDKFGKAHLSVKYDGKPNSGYICPSFQLSPEGVKTSRDAFTKAAAVAGIRNGDTVALDYEPWNASEWCYCTDCLKRFAAFAGLKAVPTPDEIRKKMPDQWAAFRVKDTTEILRAHAEIARTAGSEIKVTDYDYPMNFGNLGGRFRQIPKDSRQSDEFIDAHNNSYYHYVGKEAFNLVSINAAALKKPLIYLPLISRYTDPEQREYTNLKETLSPDQFKTAMVSSAASGAKGLSIWDGLKIDGKFFVAIDQGMAEIAALEDYFYSGTRNDKIASATPVDTGNAKLLTDNLGVRVHEYQGKTLISLFNFSISKPLSFKLKTDLPNGKYQMSDPFVKNAATEFNPAKSIDITLPPNGSKFIILKKAE